MKEVMLDLETLGNNSFASILSVGAVRFNPDVVPDGDDDTAYDAFHVYVDPASCAMHGLSMDTGTVMWWLKQDKAAQTMQVEAKRVSLPEALQAFSDWFGKESMPVWGNGATFDNVILSNAYKACGMQQPWSYRDDRCYRTIKNKAPEIELEQYGTSHNALHDAMAQARHLQRLNQHLFHREQVTDETEQLRSSLERCLDEAKGWMDEARGCKPDEVVGYDGWADEASRLL